FYLAYKSLWKLPVQNRVYRNDPAYKRYHPAPKHSGDWENRKWETGQIPGSFLRDGFFLQKLHAAEMHTRRDNWWDAEPGLVLLLHRRQLHREFWCPLPVFY